jgi:hypothetical protein
MENQYGSGCTACRRLRIKCGEELPNCHMCVKLARWCRYKKLSIRIASRKRPKRSVRASIVSQSAAERRGNTSDGVVRRPSKKSDDVYQHVETSTDIQDGTTRSYVSTEDDVTQGGSAVPGKRPTNEASHLMSVQRQTFLDRSEKACRKCYHDGREDCSSPNGNPGCTQCMTKRVVCRPLSTNSIKSIKAGCLQCVSAQRLCDKLTPCCTRCNESGLAEKCGKPLERTTKPKDTLPKGDPNECRFCSTSKERRCDGATPCRECIRHKKVCRPQYKGPPCQKCSLKTSTHYNSTTCSGPPICDRCNAKGSCTFPADDPAIQTRYYDKPTKTNAYGSDECLCCIKHKRNCDGRRPCYRCVTHKQKWCVRQLDEKTLQMTFVNAFESVVDDEGIRIIRIPDVQTPVFSGGFRIAHSGEVAKDSSLAGGQ